MRALALFAWLLALCLAVLIVRNQDTAVPAARVVQSASLALWQGEQLMPAALSAPIALPPVRPAPVLPPVPSSAVAGCARLGIFPGQAWAESVAAIIAAGEAGQPPVDWRVQPVGGKGFYVVFTGLSGDALAARLEQRRARLARLVSAAVVPERCVGPAK